MNGKDQKETMFTQQDAGSQGTKTAPKNFTFNLIRPVGEDDVRIAFMSISGHKKSSQIIFEKLEASDAPTDLLLEWLGKGQLKLEKAGSLQYDDSAF